MIRIEYEDYNDRMEDNYPKKKFLYIDTDIEEVQECTIVRKYPSQFSTNHIGVFKAHDSWTLNEKQENQIK